MLKKQILGQGCLHHLIQLKTPTASIAPPRTCPVTGSRAMRPWRCEPKICKQTVHRAPPRTKPWSCCEPLPYKSLLRHQSLDLAEQRVRSSSHSSRPVSDLP